MRIALAKVLLEKPDIMLLDEPTNYLDIEARTWLENHLSPSGSGGHTGGYLLVSHDRYFLDTTVNEVYEIFQGRLKRYAGNYSAYEKIRQQELEGLLKRYAEQQEEIAKATALIERFRYKATKAAMVQERIKKLEKMERIVIPESLKKIAISFPQPPHSGRVALTLEQIGKSYGDRPILSALDLTIEAGERLVVAGRNGAGKTTLLRIIAGVDKNFCGAVKYGTGIAAGYFSQDSAEELSGSESILAFMEREAPTALIPKVRDMLGAFLFRGDDVYKALAVLSGGEKSRLALLRLLLRPVNLLVLDEPTNHLDLHSKDVLLEALQAFAGTIIFVSHDRAFMEALSTKTLELRSNWGVGNGEGRVRNEEWGVRNEEWGVGSPSAARLFYGGYAYYLERVEEEANSAPSQRVDQLQSGTKPAFREKSGAAVSAKPLSAGEQRELSKQRDALVRRLQREEGEILAALEKLEAEKAALETELAKPEVYSNGEKAKAVKFQLDRITAELETKTAAWEEKAAELSKIGE